MYIKLLITGTCANITIREIMLINIISSASWTLQLGEFMEKTIVEMSAEAEIDIGRNRHKSGIKLSGQAQLIYINDINLNVTTR